MAGAGHDRRSGANGARSGPSWRVDTCSVEVEGVGESQFSQSLGFFMTYCPVFFKIRKFKCNFHSRFPNSMYYVILSQCYMSSRSLNKAKRRQESGQGSSGG